MEKPNNDMTIEAEVIEKAPKVKKSTKAVAIPPVAAPQFTGVEALISQAIAQGLPPETMEKFMAMRKELRAEKAKEEYDAAMADCQAEMPDIKKTKEAKDGAGKVLYKYAPLDDMAVQVGPTIAKHGFSYSFRSENTPTDVKAICIVRHRGGHSEESDMQSALSTKTGIMSAPQQIAATMSFNKRYAFMNAFGITTGDEDIDAATGPDKSVAPMTEEQRDEIDSLIVECGLTKADAIKRIRETYNINYTELSTIQAKGVIQSLTKKRDTIAAQNG